MIAVRFGRARTVHALNPVRPVVTRCGFGWDPFSPPLDRVDEPVTCTDCIRLASYPNPKRKP